MKWSAVFASSHVDGPLWAVLLFGFLFAGAVGFLGVALSASAQFPDDAEILTTDDAVPPPEL